MSNKQVKICGLTSELAVNAAVEQGADYIGFVSFEASPRHIAPKQMATLAKLLPAHVKSVMVTVDLSVAALKNIITTFTPDYIQLHGHETLEHVKEVRAAFPDIKLIKAISVRNSDDVAAAAMFGEAVDMLLFDAKAPTAAALPGGNGLSFDWNLLKDRQFSVPWMLSGGLNAENVSHAMAMTGAKMVDVSSAVESKPGEKDVQLMHSFILNAKGH